MVFYHLSDQDLGSECLFEPRKIPYESRIASLKRICVAPSVRQCLMAVGGVRGNYYCKEFFIYKIEIDKTDHALDTEWPKTEVDDHALTEEAWILFPRKFEKVGILHREKWGEYDDENKVFVREPTFEVSWLKG